MRYSIFLRERYRTILSYIGLVNLVTGIVIILPLLFLVAWPSEWRHFLGFLIPGGSLCGLGMILWRALRPHSVSGITLLEGAVVVVLSWLIASFAGSVPFIWIQGFNFTQAVFESVSGWTTTGLSVVDVTKAPHVILIYRSLMQFAGGAGIAIIMLAAFGGTVGQGLSTAEGKGNQLVPHVERSAKLVLTIYGGYAVFGFIALMIAGMNWFDALNHTFAALSTGGFSTRAESIGYWNSPWVEAVIIILMILGNLNFLTSYALVRGKFKQVIRDGEVRLQLILYSVCALIVFLGVTLGLYPALGKAIRVAVFEVVTALTTTGFSTVSYSNWNALGWLVLIVLMLIGGGTNSTAGGIKQYRIYALYRTLLWEFKRIFLPRSAVTDPDVWQAGTREFLKDVHVRQIAVFVFVYLGTFFIGSGIICAHGYPLKESLFEFASALGTVGLSVGVTTATSPAGVLWTEIAGMFLGRLEFFVVFIGLAKIFKDLYACSFSRDAKRSHFYKEG